MASRAKKTRMVPYALFLGLAGACVLFIASVIFFYRGKNVLSHLITHGQDIPATTVYGRAWPLTPDSGMTWTACLAALHMLNYTQTKEIPKAAGQFFVAPPAIVIHLRGFTAPAGRLPDQRVALHFDHERLTRVDAPASPIPWQLEPYVLTRWSTDDAAQHQQIFLRDVPAYVPQAVLAIEDKRFYHHGAFDALGVLRAFIVDIREGRVSQGASTLSQQLARSIFLSSRRTVSRKLMEAVLAMYLELRFTKRELLEMYLNQVYWGQDGSTRLLGIDAAAHAYFGTSPHSLTLSEAALLAGLLQSPNHYSPRNAPDTARERRNLVLKLMLDQGLISKQAYHTAHSEPLRVAPVSSHVNDAAYFLASLQDDLEARYPGVSLPTAGWSIFTTLDPTLEREAVRAMQQIPGAKAKTVHPEGALVAIDQATGGVRAWVGGTDFSRAPFDRAERAERQPGSAFKPFVMLAALDMHVATTATLLKDEPTTFQTANGPWSPKNYDRRFRHQASVWDSLVQSLNVPTVMLATQTGLAKVADYAKRAGIQHPLGLYPSLALGSSEVTPLELTNAYATLAEGGTYNAAYTVDAILDAEGRLVESHSTTSTRVFDALPVALVTHMLQAVLREGTAAAAQALGFSYVTDAAGKTGTSEHFQDAWFVGFTPRLTCGVWVGYDQPKSLGHAAAGIALPVWVSFMQKAIPIVGDEAFKDPAGLVKKTIDPQSGLLARSGCPTRRDMEFIPGTEPTQDCPLHAGGISGFFHRLWSPKPAANPAPHE